MDCARPAEREVDAESADWLRRLSADQIPLDALAARLGVQRNAIYKVVFDARGKIRRALAANGYLEEQGLER